jgi:hypothetical protein
MRDDESPLQFPCDFPVKAMGLASDDMEAVVRELVRPHVGELPAAAVATRESRGGRYVAVTVTVRAESRAQLDAIYLALTADARVKYAL